MNFHGHTKDFKEQKKYFRSKPLKVSPHFNSSEFFSKNSDNEVAFVHPTLIELLEYIRVQIGRPLIINSGYRDPAHNTRIGGAPASTHLYGMAADIRTPDLADLERIEQLAKPVAGGVKRYNTFVHVDIWTRRTW